MATKFAWVLKTPQSRLGIKAASLGVAAFLLTGNSGALADVVFALFALVLYAFPPHRLRSAAGSFLVLLVLVIFSAPLANTVLMQFALASVSGVLFYLILALKEMVLVERRGWRELVTLAMLSFSIFLFFLFPLSMRFAIYWLVLFAAASISIRELLNATPIALVVALLIMELSWGASLMPLNSLRAASLVVIITFVIIDIASRGLQKTLTRRVLLTDISFASALALAIGAATQWGM